jgi:hypothetical protein
MVTFRLGFDYTLSGALRTFDVVVDAFFLVDIILHTNTAFWDDSGLLVISRRAIFTRYASTWLLWDLASTVSCWRCA